MLEKEKATGNRK